MSTKARTGYDSSKPAALYVLQSECGTVVKIGISNQLEKRISTLNRWTPFRFHQVAVVRHDDGSKIAQLEKDLHSKMAMVDFSGRRFDGHTEWREWDDRLIGWLHRCASEGFSVSADGLSGSPRCGRPFGDNEFEPTARHSRPYAPYDPEKARDELRARFGSAFKRR